MSYDITVWLSQFPSDLPAAFNDLGFDRAGDDEYTVNSRNWIIHAYLIRVVEEEDVPTPVLSKLPIIAGMVQLSLQPISAPRSALALLRRTARKLAEDGTGLVEDPQTGELKLSIAARSALAARPARPADHSGDSEKTFDELELSWWFDHDRFTKPAGFDAFLSVLERYLPEALPRRYGEYEPPKFKYQETGKEAFVNFVHGTWMPTIYPTRPCFGVVYPDAERPGWETIGGSVQFRAGHVSLGFDASLLDNPLHTERLARAWGKISHFLNPFYGDVRLLGGRILGRSTLWHTAESESHPVSGPWWDGIPSEPALARVIGPPYLDLWPGLRSAAQIEGNLAFFGHFDRSESNEPGDHLTVPRELAQKRNRLHDLFGLGEIDREFPPIFPFPRPAGASH